MSSNESHNQAPIQHGGDIIAQVLKAHGVRFLFTLCGGHISPILVGCKRCDIRVVDVRHEVTSVFAADAVARLTGVPGVAAVTAGPGATNTITAIKNAQMAQSPVILLGGATATMLKGRGSLQDVDQMALFKPHVKWATTVKRVRDLASIVNKGFEIAQEGVPGPVFIECPLDLLYGEEVVRTLYGASDNGKGLAAKATNLYLSRHVNRLFAGVDKVKIPQPSPTESQALTHAPSAPQVAEAVRQLGIPTYLSGMARGLLGIDDPLHMRHKRRLALKESDLVILAGVPCDFRLNYGRHIPGRAYYIAANRSRSDMQKNRRPNLAVQGDAGQFICQLANALPAQEQWQEWLAALQARDDERNQEIGEQALQPTEWINPLHLCREMDESTAPKTILVADGGDFVGTASYIVRPPGPLTWLDPGAFGTLGVGAGFALGAKLCYPEAEVWILYGDGSVGYSLTEFDTFVRHNIPVMAVVGNDAGWSQIAREQVEMLHDDVGTVLAPTDYDRVVAGFGATGLSVNDPELVPDIFQEAKQASADGNPVLINARIGKTDFRKGSISI